MTPPFPSVFYCALLDREADRDDCHRCDLGEVCAGIPSRLMHINSQAPVGPTSGPQYPPTFRESARVGVSGQREIRRSGGRGITTGFEGRPRSLLVSLQCPAPAPAPRARRR